MIGLRVHLLKYIRLTIYEYLNTTSQTSKQTFHFLTGTEPNDEPFQIDTVR